MIWFLLYVLVALAIFSLRYVMIQAQWKSSGPWWAWLSFDRTGDPQISGVVHKQPDSETLGGVGLGAASWPVTWVLFGAVYGLWIVLRRALDWTVSVSVRLGKVLKDQEGE